MKFLSVCSGIEAASVAWRPLGWEAVAFSEIEPFPCSVLAHHYPNVPNLGDMTKLKEWPDYAIDLLCGGTPCQSFSVAGLRAGLDDPRGNLMLTFGAIAAKYRPQWLVWENVPGVLSSNGGRDFGSFLGLLSVLGYGFAYRVLDAQYFGVAQRRKRVFVVGCLGNWQRAAAVLFERHSLSGNPAPRREKGKAAPTIPSRSTAGGGLGTDFDCDGGLIAGTWQASGKAAGSATQQDAESGLLVAGTIEAALGRSRGAGTSPASLLPVCGQNGKDLAGTITADYGANKMGAPEVDAGLYIPVLAFDTTQVTSVANRSSPKYGDPCHTLAKGADAPAIAFPANLSGTQCASTENLAPSMGAKNPTAVAFGGDISRTLSARHDSSPCADRGMDVVAVAVTLRGREGGATAELGGDLQNCLRASGGGGDKPHVLTAMQVRRLTPVECARLQGFPDHYLDVLHRGKPAADGPKYKALGNSWAVPNVRWIGERINAVANIQMDAAA